MTPIISGAQKLTEVCRLCLKRSNEMSQIFEENTKTSSLTLLADKITSIAHVQIAPSDGLPPSICQNCRRQVDQFHEFRLLVEISDRALRCCLDGPNIPVNDEAEDSEIDEPEDKPRELVINSDLLNNKEQLNYTILVPTTQGLQVWNCQDPDQNKFLSRLIADSPNKPPCPAKKSLPSTSEEPDYPTFTPTDAECILPDNDISCELCSKPLQSLDELKDHISEHCQDSENDQDIIAIQDEDEGDDGDEDFKPTTDDSVIYLSANEVDIVEKPQRSPMIVKKPKKAAVPSAPFECEYCGRMYKRISKKRHYETCRQKDAKLTCLVCDKQFDKRSEWRYHKTTHSSGPLHCEPCNKVFVNKQSLKIHMDRHRLGSRFTCDHCDKRYYTSSELARHVQQHMESRKYPCNMCPRSFFSQPELNRHLKYHRGDKKFKCTICLKAYYESGHLKIHQRVHTGERPYVCDICGKGFITKSKLDRHTKIHSKPARVPPE